MARLHEINSEIRELKQQLHQSSGQPNSKRIESTGPVSQNLENDTVNARTETSETHDEGQTSRGELDQLKEQFNQLRHQLMQHKAAYRKEVEAQEAEAQLVDDANWRLQKAADLDRSAIEPVHTSEADEQVPVDLTPNLDAAVPEPGIDTSAPVESANEPVETEQPEAANQDHHAWVLDRMHKLENERKSLFRKMLQSLFTSNG